MEPLEVKPTRRLYVHARGKVSGTIGGTVSVVSYGAALTGLPVDVAYLYDAPESPWDEEWLRDTLGARLTPGAQVICSYLDRAPAEPVKPRYRFVRRNAGRYHWEPVNAAAIARSLLEEVTPILSFWGDGRTGMSVIAAAHDRAGELGMKPAEYQRHVRRLTTEARAKAAGYTPLTAEELAELIPPGSWPRGMASLPAPVPAFDVAEWYGDLSDWKPSKPARFLRMFSRKARS